MSGKEKEVLLLVTDGNGVLLLVSKGNLRHRIGKLGTEKEDGELSEAQMVLRKIAKESAVAGKWEDQKFPERPGWANGAFLYLEPEHAAAIESLVRMYGLKLQSKHVLCSQTFKPVVMRALQEGPEGPGREAFLMRRAGFIERSVLMPLPTMRPLILIHSTPYVLGDRLPVNADSDKGEAHGNTRSMLRDIARGTGKEDSSSPDPERPSWANGAVVYFHEDHIKEGHVDHVKKLIEAKKLSLHDGQVLTSWQYRTLVETALFPWEEGQNVEDFLEAREKVIAQEEALPDPKQLEECLRADRAKSSEAVAVSGTGADADNAKDEGNPSPNVLNITLDAGLMNNKDIDYDLAEFVTAPASVQKLDPGMWLTAWQYVCDENDWIEMRDHSTLGPCPYDTLCRKWAEVPHLLSKKTKQRVKQCGKQIGPFLSAILKASHSEDVSSSSSETQEASTAQSREEGSTAQTTEEVSTAQSSGYCEDALPPAAPLNRWKLKMCPTEGCSYPVNNRASTTHCCKRCQYEDILRPTHGKYSEAWQNSAGQNWKKPHGPECTCHLTEEQLDELLQSQEPCAVWTVESSVDQEGCRKIAIRQMSGKMLTKKSGEIVEPFEMEPGQTVGDLEVRLYQEVGANTFFSLLYKNVVLEDHLSCAIDDLDKLAGQNPEESPK